MLERERELVRVSELVQATAAGGFRLAVVEGPAGAGKSVLLGALAAQADLAGLRVLRATGLELEREYPFGVVRQLFEPLLYELDATERDEVFSGAAGLARGLLSREGSGSKQPLADSGFSLLHSLYWALAGLTDLGPAALVVDDGQWADVLSLRFLAFVVKRAEGLPLLVALARRDRPGDEPPDALAAVLSGPASVIRPAALSETAVGALLAEAIGQELGDEAVLEAARLTAGNPLYVRELADSLASAGGAVSDDPLRLLRDAAPAAISRRVRTTLARMDATARGIAIGTAILGDDVPLHRVARLTDMSSERAILAADELVSADILQVGEPLSFRHPLVRQAVLESVQPRARALAHAHAARLLTADGEPPQRAAIHLLEADPMGDPDVVRTLRAAARAATDEGAHEGAVGILRRALRELPTSTDRPEMLNELAVAETLSGNPEAALIDFEEAFRTSPPPEQPSDGASIYAALLINRGKFDAAKALVERVAETLSDNERRLILEAQLFSWALDIPAARERLARIAAGLTGQSAAERLVLGLQASEAAKAGKATASQAAAIVEAALGNGRLLAELGPNSPIYLRLLAEVGGLREPDGEYDRELASAVAEARRRGAWTGLAFALTFRAGNAWKRGQFVTAEAEARTACEIAIEMGWLAGAPGPLVSLVEILNEVGDCAEAERLLDANGFLGALPEGLFFSALLGARGRLRILQGRLEEGIADLEENRARLREMGSVAPISLADVSKTLVPALMQVGREEEARELADEALRRARFFDQPRYLASTLRAHALTGLGGPDMDELMEAAAIWESIDSAIGLARTLVEIGWALRRQRKPAAAREPLRRALDLARACGMRPLAERAEHELRAAGARPRRDRITGRDALTATERRVAQLAIEGLTNRQIAETLFVTRKTVESHLDHTFNKLGIHARRELERALARQDELSPVGHP